MPAGDIVVVAEAVALGEALFVKAEGVENSLGGSLGVKGGDPDYGWLEGAADGEAHTGASENSKNTQPLDIVDNQRSGGGKRGWTKPHQEEVLVGACQDSPGEKSSSGSLTEGRSGATTKRPQKKSKSPK